MQLIRPHQIFRLLCDLPVLRRQKLRTHRRIEHIIKHRLKFLIPAGIRIIMHQMAHQRLGNRTIDPVHGHMIPVISRPPKGKLRHIPCPDHKAAVLVRHIHKNLGTFSRLGILICHAVVLHIMPDIFKMPLHRLGDRDLS